MYLSKTFFNNSDGYNIDELVEDNINGMVSEIEREHNCTVEIKSITVTPLYRQDGELTYVYKVCTNIIYSLNFIKHG